MRSFIITIAMLASASLQVGCLNRALDGATPRRELANAQPSAEELIEQMLGALATKDPDALRSLRVTEAEYREILMAGNVPEGQPLRPPSKELADFAWGMLDEKSRYYEASLLQEYGGRDLAPKAVDYEDGVERFANHTLHRQLRLKLEDKATGAEVELDTGSIVEVAGHYKFASFVKD